MWAPSDSAIALLNVLCAPKRQCQIVLAPSSPGTEMASTKTVASKLWHPNFLLPNTSSMCRVKWQEGAAAADKEKTQLHMLII